MYIIAVVNLLWCSVWIGLIVFAYVMCDQFQSLLLLSELSKGNANIQKIIAFESAFERLLGIVSEEDDSQFFSRFTANNTFFDLQLILLTN